MDDEYNLNGLDQEPKKKKIPTALLILFLLLGFICVSGAAVWIEDKHNDCVVEVQECRDQCILKPQTEIDDGGIKYGKIFNE